MRVRVCVPAPHVLEQAPQPPQLVTTHGSGHSICSGQVSVSISAPHPAPPNRGCCVTVRVRVREACRPHVALQALHAPQAVCAQSTGHWCVLHSFDSDMSSGHDVPPQSGWDSTTRVRVNVPAPLASAQTLEQTSPQVDHWLTTQLDGQHSALHSLDSCMIPHGRPL